jgi:hypothetical protein
MKTNMTPSEIKRAGRELYYQMRVICPLMGAFPKGREFSKVAARLDLSANYIQKCVEAYLWEWKNTPERRWSGNESSAQWNAPGPESKNHPPPNWSADSNMQNQYPDWLRKAAAKGGKAKSAAKTAAARKANAARWKNHTPKLKWAT